MKRLTVGIVLGIAVTMAGTAAAHEFTAPAPKCRPANLGYLCSLPHLPAGGFAQYTINMRDLDLTCMFSHYSGSAEAFGCTRLSKPALKCVDDTLGSMDAYMTLAKFEVDTASHCVPKSKPPYYKLTSGYQAHVFYRSP